MELPLTSLLDADGLLLTRDALAAGVDKRTLQRAVRTGLLHRVRRGAYTTDEHWESLSAGSRHLLRARAVSLTAGTAHTLSHVTSLISWTDTWWDLPLHDVHLTRFDARAGRNEAGVCQHRARIRCGDVVSYGDLLRTTAARAALEVSTLVDLERALVVVNGLLHDGVVTRELLDRQAVDMYRNPGTLHLELVLRECDPRIESVGETRLYYALRGSGLPRPIPQYPLVGPGGQELARLDFALPALRVWLEFDGRVKYERLLRPGESPASVVLRERDRERMVERITGWVCVRVDWSDLEHPARILARIREATSVAAARRSA